MIKVDMMHGVWMLIDIRDCTSHNQESSYDLTKARMH